MARQVLTRPLSELLIFGVVERQALAKVFSRTDMYPVNGGEEQQALASSLRAAIFHLFRCPTKTKFRCPTNRNSRCPADQIVLRAPLQVPYKQKVERHSPENGSN